MKKLLNFGVVAPLTLGMGHPVEGRLKRLQHVDRNKKFLPTTIGATLLLTSAISSVSAKTDEIVRDVATPIIAAIDVAPHNIASQRVEPQSIQITQIAPQIMATAPRSIGVKPMRLRMSAYFTTEQLNAFTDTRKRLVAIDPSQSGAFNGEYINVQYYNRREVIVKDNGQAIMNISRGQGGWPGYPVTNTNWETRPLSTRMKGAIQGVIDKCARSSVPVYFVAPILDGDEDMGRGDFNVECTPGSEAVQSNTTRRDLAQAWLASDDIGLKRRQDGMAWRMSFALMDEHISKTQNASIANDRAECVRIHQLIKKKYVFSDTARDAQDMMIAKCAEKDYNWVRRRNNIPEVR